jgi:excisionase family DNA binding protein
MSESLMSASEVADFLGISVNTLHQLRYRGDPLPRGYRVGGRIKYRRADVEAWLEEQADRPKIAIGS